MSPEKFFDYLEGKLPPDEKADLETAMIASPELQREFYSARQIHRGLQRIEQGESPVAAEAGKRGRQIAAACIFLVVLNVAFGFYFIFRSARIPEAAEKAREQALRAQLESSVEKSAAAAFPSPQIGMERVGIAVARTQQDAMANIIIAAATKAGGSATKELPNESGLRVLAVVPATAAAEFRQTLQSLGGRGAANANANATPNEMVRFEISLTAPP